MAVPARLSPRRRGTSVVGVELVQCPVDSGGELGGSIRWDQSPHEHATVARQPRSEPGDIEVLRRHGSERTGVRIGGHRRGEVGRILLHHGGPSPVTEVDQFRLESAVGVAEGRRFEVVDGLAEVTCRFERGGSRQGDSEVVDRVVVGHRVFQGWTRTLVQPDGS